jgi:hypothetical protein
VRHPDAGTVEEDLGREMHDGALSAAAERDTARVRFGEYDELADVPGGQRRVSESFCPSTRTTASDEPPGE